MKMVFDREIKDQKDLEAVSAHLRWEYAHALTTGKKLVVEVWSDVSNNHKEKKVHCFMEKETCNPKPVPNVVMSDSLTT